MAADGSSALDPFRIAHVSNEAFGLDTANGVQHVVNCLARSQADLGASVAVFSRDDNAMNVLGPVSDASRTAPLGRSSAAQRSRIEWFMARYLEPQLAERVVRWRPDIVHFHSLHIPPNVALGFHFRRLDIPYCVTVHGALFPAALRRNRTVKALFTALVERRFLNQARFIHAVSPNEIEVIRRIGVTRPIVVAPNGLPADSAAAAPDADVLYATHPFLRGRRVFMFMGRLDPWQKGLDVLIEAFARAALPDAALVLVGPDCNGSRGRLEALAERLGIATAMVFLAPAFGQQRANLLAAADIFVHPSRWEGLSLSVLTAAAAGKPFVITREADPLGALERARAALIVQPAVQSLAAGLQQAATLPPEELQLMGTRARAAVSAHFAWPASAQRLIDAYRGDPTQANEQESV